MSADESPNYAVFRDCLSTTLLQPAAAADTEPRRRRRRRAKSGPAPAEPVSAEPVSASGPERDAEELSDFVEYLASEMFDSLPAGLRDLDYRLWRESEKLQALYSLPLTEESLSTLNLPPTITETLTTYKLIASDSSLDSPLPPSPEAFLLPILSSYISTLTTPPPATTATRTSACEICERSWIPLSYHHLIPRFVHDKAVKRGWHRKEDLQNVAWLCGACHRFVHHFRGHEDLARDYYTVELLMEAEEVRSFAAWVGRLRWKGGRTRRTR